jgi:hypothetical protein
MSDDRAARREAAVFVVLITVAVLAAPFSPEWTGIVVVVVLAGAAITGATRRLWFREAVARYHASPFARLCDSLFGIVRHVHRREGRDALLSLTFLVTISVPILLLELVVKKSPAVKGTVGLGLAIGVVVWHTVLEVFHEPRRRAEYAGRPSPRELPMWPLLLILAIEFLTFAVLRATDYLPDAEFLRGFLLGVVVMGLADAATLQSTMIAAMLRGRPLR